MKSIKTSFLFFYTIFSLLLLTSIQNVFAQQSMDSLNYYEKLALQPKNGNDLFYAQDYFNINYEKAIEKGDISIAINHLYYIASIEYKKGEYDKSEETAVRALNLLDKMNRSTYTESTRKSFYNLLGLMYTEQKNKPKAINLYNRALKISKTASDSANIYNNISLVYKNFDDVTNAKQEILKAYKLLPRIKDSLTQALVMDNYGVIQSKLNKTSGLDLMNKALKLRESVNDTSTIYTSYSHLAQYYYKTDSIDKSKEYAVKALKLANTINSASYKNDALGLITNLSEDTFARAYKKLNDSIYNVEKQSSNKFALMRYDYSEFERKALKSQLEEERQETRAIIALSIASFIALLSVFLYFILKSKHKKEKLQQVFDTESRISKQIHDEVANDVFQFMTKLEGEALTNADLIDDLQVIYSKTRDISKEHSLLEDDGPFTNAIKDLVLSYSDVTTSVIDKGSSDINWEAFSKIKRTTIYKVLQELLINMKKHSQASVAVLMFKNEGKKMIISYTDNGVGSEFKKSTGLQNVENRIESMHGTITFETEPNKGFKTKIVI